MGKNPSTGKVDIYRDTPVRLLGYANEAGEALRQFIGNKWVRVSYVVATLYVIADTTSKTNDVFLETKEKRMIKTLYTATDAFTWQMLASIAIPGFTINRVCAVTNYLITKSIKMGTTPRNVAVTATGLALIPFIVKPIDNLVDDILNITLRKCKP